MITLRWDLWCLFLSSCECVPDCVCCLCSHMWGPEVGGRGVLLTEPGAYQLTILAGQGAPSSRCGHVRVVMKAVERECACTSLLPLSLALPDRNLRVQQGYDQMH